MATMDKTKKKRKYIRGIVTKILKEFENTDLDADELQCKLDLIKDYKKQLQTLDEKILENDLDAKDEQECIQEMDRCRNITETINRCIRDVERKLKSVSECSNKNNDVGLSVKLPKIVLEKFDLNPHNWINFWTQFKRIDDLNISNEDKFCYLRMCLEGNSKKILEGYPNTGENYIKALEHLKKRFGRDDLIIQSLYKDLLILVKANLNVIDLYDSLSTKLRTLETLGLSKERIEILIPLIEECMPLDVRRIWERERTETYDEDVECEDEGSSSKSNKFGKVQRILTFLCREAESEERLAQYGTIGVGRQMTAAALLAPTENSNVRKVVCIFCESSHFSQNCQVNMSLEDKMKKLRDSRACFKCLRLSHNRRKCKKFVKCSLCSRQHFEVVCPGPSSPANSQYGQGQGQSNNSTGNHVSHVRNQTNPGQRRQNQVGTEDRTQSGQSHTMMSASLFVGSHKRILLKTIVARINNVTVRILLDTASHRSYITEELAKRIGLKACGEEKMKHMLFGGVTSSEVKHCQYEVTLTSMDGRHDFSFLALSQDIICGQIPVLNRELYQSILENYNIALADDGIERPISVLLGADVIGKLVLGTRKLNDDLIAFETILGWCLLGTVQVGPSASLTNLVLSLTNQTASMWDLEALGIEKPAEKGESDEVLATFDSNISQENGRYKVMLPWRDGHPPLPTNRELAEKRLWSVVRRLKRNDLYEAYDEVFKNWEKEKIIELVVNEEEKGHYLPHRPVIKEDRKTKLRPVFDASAKLPNNICLNECLHVGPNMVAELLPLLLRFRRNKFGITGDIKQAFLMIQLALETDKDMLRFLWLRDGVVITFRHCRVVFGLTSSPFLLNATIQHHLRRFKSDLAHKLRNCFYLDDCLESVTSLEEAKQFIDETKSLFLKGGFELRGWVKTGDIGDHQVLGLKWNSEKDVLGCWIPKVERKAVLTKRDLLSIVGRIYDPLGIIAAPVLFLKLLLQETFKRKLDWYESISKELQLKCESWLNEIDLIDSILVDRLVVGESCTLHAFSDASIAGMGTCIFTRFEDKNGVKVKFVASKARVCPLETLKIPKLELIAALMSSRLAATVSKNIGIDDVTYWTDSMIVLYWIKKGEWKTFVGNRVKEIRQLSNPDKWRFVPGILNAADIVSRGCLLSEYVNDAWWEGPSWLKEHPDSWPVTNLIPTDCEAKTVSFTNVPMTEKDPGLFSRISSFKRAVRVVGWILRFLKNSRKERSLRFTEHSLSIDEEKESEMTLIRWIQQNFYDKVKDLEVILGNGGLWRVKTKILSEEFEASFREPIVLPHCSLVEALIKEEHNRLHHAGVTTVLGNLRENYWIVKGRQMAKRIINSCVQCRRFKSKHVKTPAVGLPYNRVNLGKAFQTSGVDLAGPLFLKSGSKVWICLFTCAVYRAIHLELVNNISTEEFMLALRRFIARKGKVETLYSDQGTNFVGAARLIEKSTVESRLKIKWILNVPTGSWWGGFFEICVKLVKNLLRSSLGRALLNGTELYTVLTEVEGVINSRPITYHSDDPSELRPITPSMFLQEQTNCETPDLDNIDENSFSQRARYVQRIRSELKQRFRREYLGALLLRSSKAHKPIQVGEVVWIIADNIKRIDSPLGLITETFPGKDGVVRAVKIRTGSSEYLRPVQRVCRLEVSCDSAENKDLEDSGEGLLEDTYLERDEPNTLIKTRSGRIVKVRDVLDL